MSFLFFLAAFILFLLSTTPYIKNPVKEAELASHFAFQYAIGAVILALLAGFAHAQIWTYVFLLGALLLSLAQFSSFIGGGAEPVETPTLKILQANVLKLNRDTVKLRKLIAAEKPDVIICAEVTPLFAKLFADMSSSYPYGLVEAEAKSSYGMALLSRLPLAGVESFSLDSPGNRAMAAQLEWGGRVLDIFGIHPATPNVNLASRDREFDALAARYTTRHDNLIVAGDFNATPYCYAYKKLTRALHLKNAREGHGVLGSFPVFLPTGILKIAIDHVLTGTALRATSCRLGADIGSDHLPMIATIALQDV